MINKKIFFIILIFGIIMISCAPKRKGMRKSRKKDCDCPSFGQVKITVPYIYQLPHSSCNA